MACQRARDGAILRRLLARLFTLFLLSCFASAAQADESEPPRGLSTRLGADPNGASYGAEYRGAVRGRFSDQFVFYGAEGEDGYSIALAPLFELHEPRKSHNVLPSQYWRARLSLLQSYGFTFPAFHLRIGAQLTHESDHETAHAYSRPGFLALNDAAVRVLVSGGTRAVVWFASSDAQLYFLSCTDPRRTCENFRGSAGFGGQAQAAVSLPALSLLGFAPFAAASYSGIVAHGRLRSERRLLARLGFSARFKDSLLSLFALGSVGNDVGVVRNRTLNVVGAGLSFAR